MTTATDSITAKPQDGARLGRGFALLKQNPLRLDISLWIEIEDDQDPHLLAEKKLKHAKTFLDHGYQDENPDEPWEDGIEGGDGWLSTRKLFKLVHESEIEAEVAWIDDDEHDINCHLD